MLVSKNNNRLNWIVPISPGRPSVYLCAKILAQFILILFFCKVSAQGEFDFELDQTTRFDLLSVEDGLSSKDITKIHQDKFGFMWIGTQNGLNLYDGIDFKIFRKEQDNPHSLPDNYIYRIFEGTDSVLWVCSGYGLSRFNRHTEDFTNFFPDSIDFYNPINQIREIHQLGDDLFLSAGGEAYRFHIPSGEFESLDFSLLYKPDEYADASTVLLEKDMGMWFLASVDGLLVLKYYDSILEQFKTYRAKENALNAAKIYVTDFYVSNGKHVWMTSFSKGLYRLTIENDSIFEVKQFTRRGEKPVISNYFLAIFEDSKSNVWIGGKFGFFKLTADGSDFHAVDDSLNCIYLHGRGVRSFSEDANGNFWFTSFQGVIHCDFQRRHLTYYKHNPTIESSISGFHCYQTFIDNTGQIWIPTRNDGINRLNKYENAFLRNQNSKLPQSLTHNWVSSFLVDKDKNVWVGTFGGGINRTSYQENHKFSKFKNYLDFGNKSDINHFYANYFISTMCETQDGEIWAGTYLGVFNYDADLDDFIHYRGVPNDLEDFRDEAITALFEDHTGTFWVGTTNNLYILDRESKRFIPMAKTRQEAADKDLNFVSVIYEDSQNVLWLGGNNLKQYVRRDSSFKYFKPNSKDKQSISDGHIWALLEDDDTNFWIGTNDGLSKMNREDESFISIPFDSNQKGNAIHGMSTDVEGNLWMSTISGGISKYNSTSGLFKNYDESDGLVDIEYSKGGAYQDDDGWMYFGSYNGFSVFHPDSIHDNTVIPPVFIDAFSIYDEKQLFDKPLITKSEIQLNYNQNEFKFHFAALNYLNASKNQYAYMLEGYDEDWNYSGTQRFANYTNMSPGTYVFKVKASNNDGYWSEDGAQVVVVIFPPFWKTTWAYLLYIALFITVLWLVRLYEVNRLKLKQNLEINEIKSEKLKELDKEKSKFFSNISHEFRTPLTLILGPLERITRNLDDGQEKEELNLVQRNARRLQTLINQLLSISKLESGKMKLRAGPENIVALTSLLVQSFHSMAQYTGISLVFESENEEQMVFLDKMKYEKICINILSNAFKFTNRGGEIKVTIRLVNANPEEVEIRFVDSGIGIPEDELPFVFDRFYQVDKAQLQDNLGTGIGLSLTKELVELHHGQIAAESESGSGTTFAIRLALGQGHLSADEIIDSTLFVNSNRDYFANENYLFDPSISTTIAELASDETTDDGRPIVLIVDDNDDMRTYIRSYLSSIYRIVEARNGKDGRERALVHIPDLIVSDLMMPLVNGNEMTEQLKNDARTSHIPIILLTAKASRESKLEGLETGADDFLTKPFDADELLVRIKNLIGQRRKLREILAKHIGEPGQTRLIRESSGKMMTKVDEGFIEKATAVIWQQMSNPELNVEMFASELAMSRMQLHRKLTSLTGSSPSDLIRDLRLKRAAELLKEGALNVTEVSYEIGISSLSNFAKIFKKKYGETPSEYAQSQKGR